MTQGSHTAARYTLVVGVVAIGIAASLVIAIFGPGALASVASVPAIGSLSWALLEIARDRIAHDRSVFLQEAQHRFSIGATSHMAIVAFDKHVSFCEEYTAEMLKTMTTLMQKGPTKEALGHALCLSEIRSRQTLWLTSDVETELGRFEQALRKIGADAMLLHEYPNDQARTLAVKRMYSTFAEVIGLPEWEGQEVLKDLAVTTTVAKLRKILGIDELTLLRSELVKRALENLVEKTG
jgi:hypothetical protein